MTREALTQTARCVAERIYVDGAINLVTVNALAGDLIKCVPPQQRFEFLEAFGLELRELRKQYVTKVVEKAKNERNISF
jgi:HD superfamily phosphohydrolase YqeK